MAHDAAIMADVLVTDHGEARVVSEDAKVHDSGRPGVTPGSTSYAGGISYVAGSDTEPERPKPSEVITEVAPEVHPPETEPERPEPSEVITEVAPELYPPETEPERPIVEIAPERPIVEIAPERPEPSEVIAEVAPERPERE
jgi:hypothetical protein